MGARDDNESELEVCARILRALAHRIRGDLSVVTNDLAYIATLVDPAEVERARARCGRISAGLAHIGALSSAGERSLTPLARVFQIFGVPGAAVNVKLATTEFYASPELLDQAATLLKELVGEWDGVVQGGDDEDSVVLVLRLCQREEFKERYSSVSAFAGAQLGERFVVEAGLIDLIVRDHGWQIAIVCEEERPTIRLMVGTN